MKKLQKTDAEWRAQLTEEQFAVTRHAATERAFTGALLNNKDAGRYLCICCRAHLFDSGTKYDSGTGWPSFYAPSRPQAMEEVTDRSHGMVRTEVLCSQCDAHLGHRFEDGPAPTGQRYCMNSAALAFVPDAAESEGGRDSTDGETE